MKTFPPAASQKFPLRSEMTAALAAIGLCGLGTLVPAYATPPAPTPRAVAIQISVPGGAIADKGAGANAIVDGAQVTARTWQARPKAAGPAIVINPSAYDFTPYGGIPVGDSVSYYGFTVSNALVGVTQTITGISTTGDFGISSTSGSCFIGDTLFAYGGSCDLELTFNPVVGGLRTGQLIFTTDQPGSFTANLSGTALTVPSPDVRTFPSRDVFGPQRVGTTSPPQFIEVTNGGDDFLYFENITTIGDFEFVPFYGTYIPPVTGLATKSITYTNLGGCSYGLSPGSTCAALVLFKPTAPGLRSGSLFIRSSIYDSNYNDYFYRTTRVGLSGTGDDAASRPLNAPGTISFPEQYFGTQSEPVLFDITNYGTEPLEILDIVPDGNFTATDNCGVLAVGESCTVTSRFRPDAVGLRTGQAIIRTLPDTGEYVVNFLGTGVVNPFPVLLLSKATLGYGNSIIGAGNGTPVTLTSAGQLPLSLSKIYTLGDFFQTNDCPAVLAPGLSCKVTIGFLPSLLGPRLGKLMVESNAFGPPGEVQLSGTGCSFFSVTGDRIRSLQCLPGGF